MDTRFRNLLILDAVRSSFIRVMHQSIVAAYRDCGCICDTGLELTTKTRRFYVRRLPDWHHDRNDDALNVVEDLERDGGNSMLYS